MSETKSPPPPPAPAPPKPEEILGAAVPSRALDRLRAKWPERVLEVTYWCGIPLIRLEPAALVEVGRFLKEDPECRMTLLSDLCGVDMSGLGRPHPRFDVVYHLTGVETRERLTLKVAVDEDGEVPTVSGVWATANWHEREAFDMFGIRFAGHPDPRRILMPEEFDAFPLRKDFPLEGRAQDHGYWKRPEEEGRGERLS